MILLPVDVYKTYDLKIHERLLSFRGNNYVGVIFEESPFSFCKNYPDVVDETPNIWYFPAHQVTAVLDAYMENTEWDLMQKGVNEVISLLSDLFLPEQVFVQAKKDRLPIPHNFNGNNLGNYCVEIIVSPENNEVFYKTVRFSGFL